MYTKNLLIKKILFLIIMSACLLAPLQAQNMGDVNYDNSITIVDSLLIAQYYVGQNPFVFNTNTADVNCSGSIDITDSLLVAQFYVRIIHSFPCTSTPTPVTPTPSPATPTPATPTPATPTPTQVSGGMTAVEFSRLMGAGWNLGNSLEAIGPGNETAWGNPVITQNLINAVKAAGFKTLRVPVAWSSFSNAGNYTIDQSWMNRVEEVVNYGLNAGMYVIMNEHWDGGWLNHPFYSNQSELNHRLSVMWTQIANRFQRYDERLIFAGTNEVMNENDYSTPSQEMVTVQNSFNQTFVNTVRSTGGNNVTRYLVFQSFNTNIDHAVNFTTIPSDTARNRLFVEFHYYDPYNFTLNSSSNVTTWPSSAESWANEAWVDSQMRAMKNKFVNQGVGVIMGEYGVQSRANVSNFETSRIRWNQYITKAAADNDIVPVYWDNGYSGDGGMALFDRNNGRQLYPELIRTIINAAN